MLGGDGSNDDDEAGFLLVEKELLADGGGFLSTDWFCCTCGGGGRSATGSGLTAGRFLLPTVASSGASAEVFLGGRSFSADDAFFPTLSASFVSFFGFFVGCVVGDRFGGASESSSS